MKKKYKILLLVFGIFLVLAMILGTSYAMWVYSVSQDGENALNTDCFEITFTDSNDINLADAYPISDEEGSELVPYTFTIKNICNHAANYSVNIETLNNSTLNTNYIRYKLDNKISKILGNIENNDSSIFVNNNVLSSKTIDSGVLTEGKEKTYNLRMWVDLNSTKEQSASKIYKSKIVVNSSLNKYYSEATLMAAEDFENALDSIGGKYVFEKLLPATSLPDDSVTKVNVSITPDVPIYAWRDNTTLYLYSDATKVFLNSDCSNMFYHFSYIEEFDLSMFDTSRVTNMSHMFDAMFRIKNLDLSNFDTSNVTDMSSMFEDMDEIEEINLSSFDTRNVTTMESMFEVYDRETHIEHLDLSSFDTSSVINMDNMFSGLYSLKTIYVSDKWSTQNLEADDYIFYDNGFLVGGAGTKFSSSLITDKEYARVDDPANGKPGYFTLKTN